MSGAFPTIPVVDFSSILSANSADISSLPEIEELRSAISGIGFVFLRNHGISRQLVSECMYIANYMIVYRPCKYTIIIMQ